MSAVCDVGDEADSLNVCWRRRRFRHGQARGGGLDIEASLVLVPGG